MNLVTFLTFLTLSTQLTFAGRGIPDDLNQLGKTDRVWVASERIFITANHETIYTSPSGSKIQLTTTNSNLAKGEHWATINPQILKHDRVALELKKEKSALDIDNLKDDDIDELLKIEKSLNQLITKISELQLALITEDLNTITKKRIQLAINELKEQQERLRTKVDTGQYQLKNRLKKKEIDLKLAQAIRSHENKEYQAQLIALHKGKLSFQLPEDLVTQLQKGEAVWLPDNQVYATLRDNTSIHAELILNNSSLFSYDKKKLKLRIHIGSLARTLHAEFSHEKQGNARSGNRKTWSFSIDPSEGTYASNAIGTQTVASVYYQLDEPAHIIMKDQLAPLHPEILKKDGWRGVIKKIWPEAKIVMIGPQSISLNPRK